MLLCECYADEKLSDLHVLSLALSVLHHIRLCYTRIAPTCVKCLINYSISQCKYKLIENDMCEPIDSLTESVKFH